MREAQLQANIRELLRRRRGWLVYHTRDSRRSEPGFPDLVMVNQQTGRVIFAELKSQDGRVTPEQREWIDALSRGGRQVYVWRPADWHDGSILRTLMMAGAR